MQTDTFIARKGVFILGLIAFSGLLFLCNYFYLERTVCSDMAYHIFVLAQTKWFAIQNYRYGAGLSQSVPLLCMKLGLPLKLMLRYYSLSFYLWYSIYFVVLLFALRQNVIALLLPLSLVIITSDVYYWAQTELPQAMAFLILTLGVITAFCSGSGWPAIWKIVVLAACLVTSIFFHPLIVFPLVFALLYFYLNRNLTGGQLLALFIGTVAVLAFKSLFFKVGEYETKKYDGLNNFVSLFPDYFSIVSNQFTLSEIYSNYIFLSVALLLLIVFYAWRKYWTKLLLLVLFVFSYTMLCNVAHPELGRGIYLQNMHLLLTVIILLPFLMEVAPLVNKKYLLVVFLVVIVVRLGVIYNVNDSYSIRLNFIKRLVATARQYPGSKFCISNESILPSEYSEPWALSYETLIFSSLNSADSSLTVVTNNYCVERPLMVNGTNFFINPYCDPNIQHIPAEYFKLKPEPYQSIK